MNDTPHILCTNLKVSGPHTRSMLAASAFFVFARVSFSGRDFDAGVTSSSQP